MKKVSFILLLTSLIAASCTSNQLPSTVSDSTSVDSTVVDSLYKSTDSLHLESPIIEK